ncbi:hypothetical protein [Proteus mirabilis]|uniref:hypothetical protein n=1 Tax=Proteus mirabilis TaxID=584 RepID=UPI0034D54EE1
MISALNFKPNLWYKEINNSPNSSVSYNEYGDAIIKSVKKESAYIYMPVSIGSGETINVKATVFVKNGNAIIYTSEDEFSGKVHNKLTISGGELKTVEISHTARLSNNQLKLFIKIGSDSSMDSEVIIHSITIERITSNFGSLRDMAFGFFEIKDGGVSLHDRYPSLNIESVSIDTDKLTIKLSDVYLISSSLWHKNMIPLMYVNDLNSISNIYPKITEYDQYTRNITIKFVNLNGGGFLNPKELNTRIIFNSKVP